MFLLATGIGAETGGPIGAAVGGFIDLGLAIFGFLSGGGPSVPRWSDTAWAVGPVQTTPGIGIGGNSGHWWAGCGFLYGTVCGLNPYLTDFMPTSYVEGTAKLSQDSEQRKISQPRLRTTRRYASRIFLRIGGRSWFPGLVPAFWIQREPALNKVQPISRPKRGSTHPGVF